MPNYKIPAPIEAELEELLPVAREQDEHGHLYRDIRDLAATCLREGIRAKRARMLEEAARLEPGDG